MEYLTELKNLCSTQTFLLIICLIGRILFSFLTFTFSFLISYFFCISYVKCNFSVKFPIEYLKEAGMPRKTIKKPQKSSNPHPQKKGKRVIPNLDDEDEDDEEIQEQQNEKIEEEESSIANDFEISSNTPWDEVQAYLGIKGRPFIYNSPAGATKIYGYPGLAVEVLSNGYLGSVYMFPPHP